jgi:hypothetical protein
MGVLWSGSRSCLLVGGDLARCAYASAMASLRSLLEVMLWMFRGGPGLGRELSRIVSHSLRESSWSELSLLVLLSPIRALAMLATYIWFWWKFNRVWRYEAVVPVGEVEATPSVEGASAVCACPGCFPPIADGVDAAPSSPFDYESVDWDALSFAPGDEDAFAADSGSEDELPLLEGHAWVRDLTAEGIEPNPGPPNKGRRTKSTSVCYACSKPVKEGHAFCFAKKGGPDCRRDTLASLKEAGIDCCISPLCLALLDSSGKATPVYKDFWRSDGGSGENAHKSGDLKFASDLCEPCRGKRDALRENVQRAPSRLQLVLEKHGKRSDAVSKSISDAVAQERGGEDAAKEARRERREALEDAKAERQAFEDEVKSINTTPLVDRVKDTEALKETLGVLAEKSLELADIQRERTEEMQTLQAYRNSVDPSMQVAVIEAGDNYVSLLAASIDADKKDDPSVAASSGILPEEGVFCPLLSASDDDSYEFSWGVLSVPSDDDDAADTVPCVKASGKAPPLRLSPGPAPTESKVKRSWRLPCGGPTSPPGGAGSIPPAPVPPSDVSPLLPTPVLGENGLSSRPGLPEVGKKFAVHIQDALGNYALSLRNKFPDASGATLVDTYRTRGSGFFSRKRLYDNVRRQFPRVSREYGASYTLAFVVTAMVFCLSLSCISSGHSMRLPLMWRNEVDADLPFDLPHIHRNPTFWVENLPSSLLRAYHILSLPGSPISWNSTWQVVHSPHGWPVTFSLESVDDERLDARDWIWKKVGLTPPPAPTGVLSTLAFPLKATYAFLEPYGSFWARDVLHATIGQFAPEAATTLLWGRNVYIHHVVLRPLFVLEWLALFVGLYLASACLKVFLRDNSLSFGEDVWSHARIEVSHTILSVHENTGKPDQRTASDALGVITFANVTVTVERRITLYVPGCFGPERIWFRDYGEEQPWQDHVTDAIVIPFSHLILASRNARVLDAETLLVALADRARRTTAVNCNTQHAADFDWYAGALYYMAVLLDRGMTVCGVSARYRS